MKLNIAICDDENRILTHTSSLIDIYQFQHLDTNLSVDCYTSGESLLENYTQPRQYHILLLDIEMPGMNGIETARQIRNTIDRNAIIVFISSYPEYMQESFSVHPYFFLQKPATQENMNQLLDEIIDEITNSTHMYTLIDIEDIQHAIYLNDVLYIHTYNARKELLSFHLPNKELHTKGHLGEWETKLQNYHYIPCYRGYLVNLTHIHYVTKDQLILDNNEAIPLSRTNRKRIHQLFLDQVVTIE